MSSKNRKKLVSILAGILALLLLLPLLVSALTASASAASSAELLDQINDLKGEAAAIEAQQAELQSQIDSNSSETASVMDEKYMVDQQIAITSLTVDNINQQIQSYSVLIASKQEELDAAIAREDERYEQFKLRIRSMEENGTVSYLSILFGSASFSDMLDRLDLIGEIAEYDQIIMQQLSDSREEIAAAQAELDADKLELNDVKAELAVQEELLQQQRAQADTYIVQLSEQADQLEGEYAEVEAQEAVLREDMLALVADYNEAVAVEEEERRRKEEEAEKARQAAAAAAASSGSSSNYASSTAAKYSYYSGGTAEESGFLYPLPAGTASVSCAFGYRIHPITGKYSMHTGVDLAAPSGTNIYAAKSGTVAVSTSNSVYGNYVVVSHGSNQATLYAHMTSRAVSEGDYVAQGETIGYVGTTGWSTGNHLHFEVMIDGEYCNPMSYVTVQ